MRICVFCGSSAGNRPDYVEAAAEVGRLLADRGIGLVYGGASIGVMGAMADAALAAGGEVVGVIPLSLQEHEIAHARLSALHVVDGMAARKAKMAWLSDAFLVLPGGLGTLDKLVEALTFARLGVHSHPVGVWNLQGYWTPLLDLFDSMVAQGFLRSAARDELIIGDALEPLVDRLVAAAP